MFPVTNFVCKDMKTVILVESGAEGAEPVVEKEDFHFTFSFLYGLNYFSSKCIVKYFKFKALIKK